MKASCPHCKKAFSAPSEWAGRKVKCPSCKKSMTLPKSGDGEAKDLGFDLGTLDLMEQVGEPVVRERKGKPMTLKEAQAATAAARQADSAEPPPAADPAIRKCPGCGELVRSTEIYGDLICRNCGAAISGKEIKQQKTRYTTLSDRMTVSTTFYTGFSSAALYPLPALGAIGLGMGIGLAAIALPLFPILAFTGASGANEIVREKTDFGWVGMFLTVMFSIEAIYFGAVAYFVMIDTIRTTTSGAEQPPPLTWSLTKLGGALGGYAALIGFYGLVVVLLLTAHNGTVPASINDLQPLADPVSLLLIALLTFAVPMNLIGLASTQALDGLNPVRFGPSIGKTIGHYTFLFLLVLLYIGFYIGIMYAVMSWAWPMITKSMNSSNDGLAKIMLSALAGLGAWSVLIGLALYFAYALGRVLGLFSRTYRGQLSFEL